MDLKEYWKLLDKIIPSKTSQTIFEIELLFYDLYSELKDIKMIEEVITQNNEIGNLKEKELKDLQHLLNVRELEAKRNIFKITNYKEQFPLEINLVDNFKQLMDEKYFKPKNKLEKLNKKTIIKTAYHLISKSKKIEQIIDLVSEKGLKCDENLELTMLYNLNCMYDTLYLHLMKYLSSIHFHLNMEYIDDNFGLLSELDNYYLDKDINVGYLVAVINSSSVNIQEGRELTELINIYKEYLERKDGSKATLK